MRTSDEDEIVTVIETEKAAFWMGDFDTWASCYVQGPATWFWSYSRTGGVAVREGWADFSARIRKTMSEFNRPSPRFASVKPGGLAIHATGDMAWATFTQSYPPGGPFADRGFGPGGLTRDLRILERREGRWKIVLNSSVDLGLNGYGGTLLRLDAAGRVLWKSEDADDAIAETGDLVIRGGRLRMRNRSADSKLTTALEWAGGVDRGLMGFRGAVPVVIGAGDEPARLWWLIAESGMILFAAQHRTLTAERLAYAAAVYGLSQAQSAIAMKIVDGKGVAEIAAETGTSENTVRTQLRRMYAKVGVHSQAELVRVFLSVAAPR